MRKNTTLPSGSTSTVRVTTRSTVRTLGRYLPRIEASRPRARPAKAALGGSAAPLAAGAKLVSHAMERLDEALAARRLELGADVPDVAVDGAVGDLAVGGVDVADQAVAVAHVLGPAQELLEQRELGGREGNRPPRVACRVLRRIEAEEAVLQRAGPCRGRLRRSQALQDHLDARHQLARTEGLRHIVVAADLQAEDAVHLRVVRGQEEDRHVGRLADLPAHAETVQFGKAHVEDDEIGVALAEGAERRPAVAGL